MAGSANGSILPKLIPRERSYSASMSGSSTDALPSSSVTKYSDTSGWKANALDFHDQVIGEVKRLIEAVEDEAAVKEALKELKQAKIPRNENRRKMIPEKYHEKVQQLMTLLKRIELTGPAILQPLLMEERSSFDTKDALLPTPCLEQSKPKPAFLLKSRNAPTLGKGHAIPLCFPNDMEWDQQEYKSKQLKDVERKSLILNPHALEILRSISGPVCVIAIVGPCRTGKSYILSRLISSSTGVKARFDLGHEMDPKTMGIWMWDQPFKMKLPSYSKAVTIILLDTEGIDAANATDQGDNQIFTLSVLLSSLLIYNSISVPKREDLNQMNFVANLSKSIQVQAGKSAVGEEGMKVVDSNPRFMWLLRDVTLMPTDKNGKRCHIKDHLLQKVLVEKSTDDEAQKQIRQCILSFFSMFEAETLPPPSTDHLVMRNIENPIYQKKISPAFLRKVEDIKEKIFSICTPKKGFSGGSVVSGFQLAHMVELYVDALNSPGGIPVIGSTWRCVLEATYTQGVESAVQVYKEVMEKAAKLLPMESDKLLGNHRKGVERMMKIFKETASLDSEREVYEDYLDKLMAKIAIYDEDGGCSGGLLAYFLEKNYGASKSTCQTLVKSLEIEHLDPLIKNLTPETDFNSIENAFKTLIAQYDERCIGPASDDVLNAFIKNQEKQREQLESQLSTIKNYNDQAKQRMKELKEEQSRFKQKEIEMNLRMEQARRDQEAKLQAMTDKFNKDAEAVRLANSKAMEEQEKRLKNMADANLQQLKNENAQQMSQLNATLQQKESELRQLSSSAQAERGRQQAEINRLQQQLQAALNRGGSGGGCFIAGTKVTLTSGEDFNIEKQAGGLKIIALGGEVTTITDEFVDHLLGPGQKLVGFNDDIPFAALHHPFWTAEGWKCLDPDTAKQENPNVDFKLLQIGDIIFQIAQTNPLLYQPVKICRFVFTTLLEPTKIFGLHLDGPRSYHANGYAVMANYPVFTKRRIREGMKKLSEEERTSLTAAISSVNIELTKLLGGWAKDALFDLGLSGKMLSD